jgi:DNA-binding beta-propeller fold protein YncE
MMVVSTIAGAYGGEVTDGPLDVARFLGPRALALTDSATLLTVDSTYTKAMRQIDLASGQVRTVYHDAYIGDYTVLGINQLWQVAGIAAHAGNVWVSMPAGHVVYQLDPSQTPWRRVGLYGYSQESATVDGPRGAARFQTPRGLATDEQGNLYVADSDGGTVRKIDPSGTTSTVAHGLSAPVAVAAAGDRLYVAEPSRIVRVDMASGAIDPVTSDGWAGIAAIAYHPAGVLYVADADGHRVRAVQVATGAVLDLAGDPAREVVIPGPLPGALARPEGLVVLPEGDVYFTDASDNAILHLR